MNLKSWRCVRRRFHRVIIKAVGEPDDVKRTVDMSASVQQDADNAKGKTENVICYVALGSNLGASVAYCKYAIEAFQTSLLIDHLNISPF